MAHWHDFNPWASELVYLPDELEAAYLVMHSSPKEVVRLWQRLGKIDIYLLQDGPLSKTREFHLGIRFGKENNEYLSPYIDQTRAATLWVKYS